ncbi:MAG TPA: peptide chain release factor N(5)-glutamine methyltransferase [Gemmatimonadaceae bacterium]|nr:peptide chain release factor N(5)-glutamine methyltransferase [Gemmatimonadaceae bacterium]
MSSALSGSEAISDAERSVTTVVHDLIVTLADADMQNPRRLATDIIAAILEVPRSWPSMNGDVSIDQHTVTSARNAAALIGAGAPFAYAVGCAAFRHLNLEVDARVLIPRPETEVLVGIVLERMESRFGTRSWGTAADIGTGSGAIALSLANEGRFDRVIATDVSIDALDVARINAKRSHATIKSVVEFRHGSLLSPIRDVEASVVVSNPPYIAYSEAELLPASVRDWEPAVALMCGNDGMAATTSIMRDAAFVLSRGGLLALEVDSRRASLVAEALMVNGSYGDISVAMDLAGRERFVLATRI